MDQTSGLRSVFLKHFSITHTASGTVCADTFGSRWRVPFITVNNRRCLRTLIDTRSVDPFLTNGATCDDAISRSPQSLQLFRNVGANLDTWLLSIPMLLVKWRSRQFLTRNSHILVAVHEAIELEVNVSSFFLRIFPVRAFEWPWPDEPRSKDTLRLFAKPDHVEAIAGNGLFWIAHAPSCP
jgi:hypothetical protein